MSEFVRFQANADSLVRQTEINEWESNSKLDTLFLLQLSCIAIFILCVIAYAASAGLISRILIYYVGVVFAGILVYLIVVKSMTRGKRDGRVWSQMKFPRAEAEAAAPPTSPDLVKQRAEELLGTKGSA